MNDAEDTKPSLGYHESGTWKGFKKYQCDLCPFDALDTGRMESHVVMAHPLGHLEKRPEPLDVPLYDGRGNLITHK